MILTNNFLKRLKNPACPKPRTFLALAILEVATLIPKIRMYFLKLTKFAGFLKSPSNFPPASLLKSSNYSFQFLGQNLLEQSTSWRWELISNITFVLPL